MEAPMPILALLHAGANNGGGFLLIRFADVMLLSPLVLAVLEGIGGFTALFGGVVMLTQPTVKMSLAWSTAAKIGFMTLQCGLGCSRSPCRISSPIRSIRRMPSSPRAARSGRWPRSAVPALSRCQIWAQSRGHLHWHWRSMLWSMPFCRY